MTDLGEIKALLDRISPYPWAHNRCFDGDHMVSDADGDSVAIASRVYPETTIGLDADDAEFIARAPELIARLIAELEKAGQE